MEDGYDSHSVSEFRDFSATENDEYNQIEDYFNYEHEEEVTTYLPNNLRRSMSMGNILPNNGQWSLLNLADKSEVFTSRECIEVGSENQTNARSSSTTKLVNNGSQNRINELAKPKQRSISNNQMTSAEFIEKFQKGTPKRFRSCSRNALDDRLAKKSGSIKKKIVSETKRSPSRKIIFGPTSAQASKPTTIVRPFQIVNILPKKEQSEEEITLPLRENFVNWERIRLPTLRRQVPVLGIFERYQEASKLRRDRLMKETLEAEKKRRQFHARPVPKYLSTAPPVIKQRRQISRENIAQSHAKSDNNLANKFKPRHGSVLNKNPIVLKSDRSRPLTEIAEFNLHTKSRAIAREQFDAKIREKEQRRAEERQKQEVLKEKLAIEEALQIRNNIKYKANRIRQFKPIEIVEPKPITVPISPKFLRYERTKN